MKEKVEQILNCLMQATGQALVYMTFGLWTKKKHPELWKEFLKETKS
jgi:hypothetical protein